MTDPTPATQITAAQIAELKEALANATKGAWSADDGRVIAPPSDSDRTYDLICSTLYSDLHQAYCLANASFIALAHNLLPSLIAAAEEAGRLKGVLAEIKHLNSIDLGSNMEMYAFAKELKRQNEAMRGALTRIKDKRLGDQPASDGRSEYEWARDHFIEQRKIAHTVLAQLDAPSEDPAGEGEATQPGATTADPELPGRGGPMAGHAVDAWNAKHGPAINEFAAWICGSPEQASSPRLQEIGRGTAVRQMKGLFFQLTPEQQHAALNYGGPENVGAPEPSALAEARETIAEAVEIIRPVARAYDGAINEIVLTWIQESPDESRIVEHRGRGGGGIAMELRQKSWRFLESLRSLGGEASRSQLLCVTSREEDRARQACRKKGLAAFYGGKWRLTVDGELALRSKARQKPAERAAGE